jgi:hypothetical protein
MRVNSDSIQCDVGSMIYVCKNDIVSGITVSMVCKFLRNNLKIIMSYSFHFFHNCEKFKLRSIYLLQILTVRCSRWPRNSLILMLSLLSGWCTVCCGLCCLHFGSARYLHLLVQFEGGSPHCAATQGVCMYKGWAIKTSPGTATFNDLLCFTQRVNQQINNHHESLKIVTL